jgi:DNA (cytosine-5)-methyltransferase 1
MENVKGMANWEKGKAIHAILDELEKPVRYKNNNHYYQVSFDVLNAADYGLSQYRERLFIVGNRIGKEFNFPDPTHGQADHDNLFENNVAPYNTVWDAIGTLPPADEPSETARRVSKTIKGRIIKHGY